MAEVSLSNYEMNQQAYQNLPPVTEEVIQERKNELELWYEAFSKLNYVGLLCRERNDYTLIHINNFNFAGAVQETIEILNSRGEIIDIRYNADGDYYEYWVRERRTESIDDLEKAFDYQWTPQVWMYIVFNATEWVVETE